MESTDARSYPEAQRETPLSSPDSEPSPTRPSALSVAPGPLPRHPPARLPPRVLVWPLLLLLCGLAVTYRGALVQHRSEITRLREVVRVDIGPIRGTLSRELFGALHLTEGLASLIAVERGISDDKFQAFARELFRRTDVIHNVAIAPDNVVRYVYPPGNELTLGLDYAKTPAQWPSVARMMAEQRMVVAGPVPLVQGGVGVIGRTPVYVDEESPAGERERRYWGLVSTVLSFDELLSKTVLTKLSEKYALALRGRDGLGERGAVFWGDASVFEASPVVVDVPLPAGSWLLAALPRAGWPPFSLWSSTYFLTGSLLSAVLAGLLLSLLRAGHAREQEIKQRRRAELALRRSMAELEQAREHLEERVRERTRELSVARDAAESADRLKSAFLATMSHELRTPLNSIIGFSGILLQNLAGPLNAEQEKQLGMVFKSAKHLLALINDVLDLSKIEAGQLTVYREVFDLRASIEKTVATLRPQIEQKGLALEVDIAPEIGTLYSDVRRVEQVLLNLLSNGVKFTEHGSIRVEAKQAEGRVMVSVSDTGLGIQSHELDKLFRPFSQIDTGINRRHEGTGLGLSICKRLIELLGGTIWVKSEWGRGSTFGFELPIELEAKE